MKVLHCLTILFFCCCVGTSWAQSDSWKVEALEEIQQTLTPARIDRSIVKHRLYDDSKLESYNSASFYYRACLKWAALPKSHRSQLYEKRKAWLDSSIADFPTTEVEQWMSRNEEVFNELKRGIRGTCDWGFPNGEITFSQQTEMGFSVEQALLNELGDLLRLKARIHIGRSEFEKAITSIAGCIKLARDAGNLPAPFLGATMTTGIAFPAIVTIRELASVPNSPNLLTALQTLPRPISDYLSNIKQQHQVIERSFKILDNPEESDRTDAQWRIAFLEALEQIDQAHRWNLERDYPNVEQELAASRQQRLSILFAKNYPVAKRRLIGAGWSAKELNKMPVGQVIAIQTRRLWDQYTGLHDGIENMPASRVHNRALQLENSELIYGELHGCFPLNLIVLTQENLLRSRWQLVEISMNLQLLRDHLAKTGSLPTAEQFDEMNPFPDPETDLPFQYRRLENGDAQLQSKPAFHEGSPQRSYVRVRYNIKKAIQK